MGSCLDPHLVAEAKARGEKSYELVAPYLKTFPYEDENAANVPSDLYDLSEDDDDYEDLIGVDPNPHERFMRFLKQVRESNGYDVDCFPPPKIDSPFLPTDMSLEHPRFPEKLMRVVNFAIEKINSSEGKHYEFVKVEKVVKTITMDMLLTLSIRDADDDSIKALRTMLDVPFGLDEDEFKLLEWRLEPPMPAADKSPEEMEPMKKKARSVNSPEEMEPMKKKAKIEEGIARIVEGKVPG